MRIGMIIFWIVWLVCGFLMSWWTDSNLDWALTYLKGETVDVPFWLSAVISVTCSGGIFAFNIIVELFKVVVG